MQTGEYKLAPVLLGADLNCYHMARCFYEEYGVISDAFGKYPLAVTSTARCIRFHTVPNLSDPDTLVSVLRSHARSGEELRPLIGCTDEYVLLLARLRNRLEEHYGLPYADAALIRRLTHKAQFAEYAARFGIPHPKTVVLATRTVPEVLPFDDPVIVKPADSIAYWQSPFPGMRKVYLAHNRRELCDAVASIYSGGYSGETVLQEYLPGGDDASYVLTTYSDRAGKVVAACFGHVLLEEHTPKGTGNHVAVLTEPIPPSVSPLFSLLEAEGYRGFANFDLRYDRERGCFFVLECNARQGRSHYYLAAAGISPARLVVQDCFTELPLSMQTGRYGVFWRCVPERVILRSLSPALQKQVQAAKAAGNAADSLDAPEEKRGNPKRKIWIWLHGIRCFYKYRRASKWARKGEERFGAQG